MLQLHFKAKVLNKNATLEQSVRAELGWISSTLLRRLRSVCPHQLTTSVRTLSSTGR